MRMPTTELNHKIILINGAAGFDAGVALDKRSIDIVCAAIIDYCVPIR